MITIVWSGILAAALAGPLQVRPPAHEKDSLEAWFEDHWKKRDLKPALPCEDAAFLRRVSLDLTGVLPEPDEIRSFLRSSRKEKRAQKIEELLTSPKAAEYFAYQWVQ